MHIEAILEARELNRSLEPETATWQRGLGDDFYNKLAAKGLAPSRAKTELILLGAFIDEFITKRKAKESSKEVWRGGKLPLVEFFGVANRCRKSRPAAPMTTLVFSGARHGVIQSLVKPFRV